MQVQAIDEPGSHDARDGIALLRIGSSLTPARRPRPSA